LPSTTRPESIVLSCRLLRRSDCTAGLNAGTRATPDLPSLNPHVIPDRLHPLDATGNLDRLIDVGLGIDEAAQLNYTLEGFDVDFGDFKEGSWKTAALTFVVITVSSIYSPVPSCFEVEAQPKKEANRTANRKAEKLVSCVMARPPDE
jgi:hypothetical protein